MANPSLEIRINSLDDARSAVQNAPHIIKAAGSNKLSSIELLIEDKVFEAAQKVVIGAFGNIQTFYSKTGVRPDNRLFILPHIVVPVKKVKQVVKK